MRNRVKLLLLAVAGMIVPAGLLMAVGVQPASAATPVSLPISSYYQMAVDAAQGHAALHQHGFDLLAWYGRRRPGDVMHSHRDRQNLSRPDDADRGGHLCYRHQRGELLQQFLHTLSGQHRRTGRMLVQLHPGRSWLRYSDRHR